VEVAPIDADGPWHLAELRVGTGLNLPGCRVLELAAHRQAGPAMFDATLATAVASPESGGKATICNP